MTNLFLALMVFFLAAISPASALCGISTESKTEPSCCCAVAVDTTDECLSLNDSCCSMSEQVPAAPASSDFRVTPSVPLAANARIRTNFSRANAPSESAKLAHDTSVPLHLASNKLYLAKRSLLI